MYNVDNLIFFLTINFIIVYFVGKIFEMVKMPKLLGYLLYGILIGSVFVFQSDIISKLIISLSLTVVLFKAGLGIDKEILQKVGKRSILLGIIPNLVEGFAVTTLCMLVFDVTFIEAGMLGFIISAVSPAVVIPSMIKIKEKGLGEKSGLPTMNLASASIDDAVSISMFTFFFVAYQTGSTDALDLLIAPISIVLGLGIGISFGIILNKIKSQISNNNLMYIFTFIVVLFLSTYKYINPTNYVSSAILILTIGYMMNNYSKDTVIVSKGISNIWLIAQVLLFFIIGTKVDVTNLLDVSLVGIVVILIGLCFRVISSVICLTSSHFNSKERIFNGICNIPKATVQASLGSLPLMYMSSNEIDTEFGMIILSMSVLSILLTAPLGLILIENLSDKMLD